MIQVRADAYVHRQLFMFSDDAKRVDMYFVSRSFQQAILMEDFDVLKFCPAKNWWPWCCCCDKFLFPAEGHRCSKRHKTLRLRLDANGGLPPQWLVDQGKSIVARVDDLAREAGYPFGPMVWPVPDVNDHQIAARAVP